MLTIDIFASVSVLFSVTIDRREVQLLLPTKNEEFMYVLSGTLTRKLLVVHPYLRTYVCLSVFDIQYSTYDDRQ